MTLERTTGTAAEVTFGVMARAPIPGRCKTRLARTIGDTAAAQLYRAMLEDRIASIAVLPARRRVLVAAPEDGGGSLLAPLLPADWTMMVQRGVDLGARLANAMGDLATGGDLVCLVDSDSPALSFADSWSLLAEPRGSDVVVLGPCEDGGYYLIGMRAAHRGVFDGIPWSTAEVAEATRAQCRRLGLEVVELPMAYDVDEAPDLERLRNELPGLEARAPRTAGVLRELASVALKEEG